MISNNPYTSKHTMILRLLVGMEDVEFWSAIKIKSKHRNLVINYFSFVLAFCICIVIALLIGGVGGLVPLNEVWFTITSNLILQSSDLAFRLFLSTLPLILLMNLSYLRFKQINTSLSLFTKEMIVKVTLGTLVALPLLILITSIMIVTFELTVGMWESLPVWGIIFFVVPLIYMLSLTAIADNGRRKALSSLVRNPEMWIIYVVVSLLLIVPVAGVVLPFFRGYWTAIPWGEAFDLLLRAFSVSLILPAIPYTFARFSLKDSETDAVESM